MPRVHRSFFAKSPRTTVAVAYFKMRGIFVASIADLGGGDQPQANGKWVRNFADVALSCNLPHPIPEEQRRRIVATITSGATYLYGVKNV